MLPPPAYDEVRSAEVIGALCLATDLGMGLPLEHGLRSTMVAMRLAERLGLDEDQSRQAFYGCLLFYVGCTADAETEAAALPAGRPAPTLRPGDVRLIPRRPRWGSCAPWPIPTAPHRSVCFRV